MPASSVSSAAAKSQRMSFVQQRLWFVEQLQSPAGVANPAVAIRIIGALEPEKLGVHLGQAVTRQEVFRTRFVLNASDVPEAQVLAQAPFLLRQEDMSQQRKQLEKRLQQELQARFDLTHPPLLRGLLIRLADTEHVLLLCAHPVVVDACSLVRFANDWMADFAHSIDGAGDPQVAAAAVGYGDFAAWQQQEWHNGTWNAALHEICDSLQGVPEVLALPWDRPRPDLQTHDVSMAGLPVPAVLLGKLSALCEQHSLRLETVLFGLYALLLARISSQTDVCIGMPVDTRASTSVDSLPGHFENLLPLRVRVAFDKPVLQLLQDIQTHYDFMVARKALPYEKVLETLALPRSVRYAPLLQVAFSTQPRGLQSPVCKSLRFERFPLAPDSSPFDLQLHVALRDKQNDKQSEQTLFTWQYNNALLERRTVEQWHQYFLTLLNSVTQNIDVPAGRVALLDEAQQQALLAQLSGDSVQIALKQSLYGRIALLSRQVPRHTAIIQGEQFVRYQSLVQQTEMWAASLRSLGVNAGERVVLAMPRSAEAIVALLAVWRAGGCAVPVPHDIPEERARAILQHCQPALTLFHAGTPVSEESQRWRSAAQGIGQFSTLAGLPAVTNLRDEALPRMDAPAVFFLAPESGEATMDSRHAPAFAQVTHGALLNLFQSLSLRLQLRASVQWLSMAEFHDVTCLVESLMPLLSGAGLVIASPQELESDDAWLALVKQRNITCMVGDVARFRPLLARHAMPAGMTLLSRNEVIADDALQAFLDAGATWVNLTGTAETAGVCALDVVARKSGDAECAPLQIGKPVLNTRLRVIDEQGMQVLPGGSGELLVGGGSVSPGYWQRDDLNNERFVQANGERYFRTGFHVRLDSAGRLHLLDRVLTRAIETSDPLPAASLEQAVLRCWQLMLGRDDIDVEQSFADLGGTSLAALRLAAHINRYFGAELPLAVLLQTATVRAQAWCLQNAGVPLSAMSLLVWQKGEPGCLPWVFLHDEQGSTGHWQAHLTSIPACVPVYALQCNRYGEAASMVALAEECLALLPEGHVLLAGAGFGGALAAAMGAQAPARIRRVVMIDTPLCWEALPVPVEGAEVADDVTDEHAEQLSNHYHQLWKQPPANILQMPVQLLTGASGTNDSHRAWALYAATLDVVPIFDVVPVVDGVPKQGDRSHLLAQWFAQTDLIVRDTVTPDPEAHECPETPEATLSAGEVA